ncbi:GNS1/SUR4 family protein [Cooperia oncophora]
MARYDYAPKYGLENYTLVLPLEDTFDPVRSTTWMQESWLHSVSFSVGYVALIYAGQKFMEGRKPFGLEKPLFAWNLGLAIFSLVGFLRMTPEWFWSWNDNSFVYSVCTASYAQGVTGFWTEQFAMSKVAELLDTAFIVLRKRPLLFLHWYHHVTVLIFTWHAYKDHTASGTNSFVYSVCTASYAQGVTGFWTEQFAMSKVAELLDTAFIVLRKRPLLFLHWYHHVTVLIFTWHAYKDHTASGRWFIWMNYGVHALMYTYYALRALRVRLPKHVAMVVTVLQISQMVMGIFIGIVVYRRKSSGESCQQTWENLGLCFMIYFTYFLLFCNFFYHAYLKKNNRYVADKKTPSKAELEPLSKEPKEDINANISEPMVLTRNAARRRAQKVD